MPPSPQTRAKRAIPAALVWRRTWLAVWCLQSAVGGSASRPTTNIPHPHPTFGFSCHLLASLARHNTTKHSVSNRSAIDRCSLLIVIARSTGPTQLEYDLEEALFSPSGLHPLLGQYCAWTHIVNPCESIETGHGVSDNTDPVCEVLLPFYTAAPSTLRSAHLRSCSSIETHQTYDVGLRLVDLESFRDLLQKSPLYT